MKPLNFSPSAEQPGNIPKLKQSDSKEGLHTPSKTTRAHMESVLNLNNLEALKIYRILSSEEKSYLLAIHSDEHVNNTDLLGLYYDIKSQPQVYNSLMEHIIEEQHVRNLNKPQRYEYLSLEKNFSITSGSVHPEIIISLADGEKFLKDKLSVLSKHFSTQDFEELYRKGLNAVYATVKHSIHKNQVKF